MNTMWFFDAQNIIYTRVKTRATNALKAEFPNIYFTRDGETQSKPKFPTVYIQFLQGAEQAETLSSDGVGAFKCNMQVDVYTSKELGRKSAEKVMAEIVSNFRKMGFSMSEMPNYLSTNNGTIRLVARGGRTLAVNDTIK